MLACQEQNENFFRFSAVPDALSPLSRKRAAQRPADPGPRGRRLAPWVPGLRRAGPGKDGGGARVRPRAAHRPGSPAADRGILTVKVVPSRSVEVAVIAPPCERAISEAM
jgi:hypothetical protein